MGLGRRSGISIYGGDLGSRLINLCLNLCKGRYGGLLYDLCLWEVGMWETLRWQGGHRPVHAGLGQDGRGNGGLHSCLKHWRGCTWVYKCW